MRTCRNRKACSKGAGEASGLDQPLSGQRGEVPLECAAGVGRKEVGDRAGQKIAPDHGPTLEDSALTRAEPVEPGREERPQGWRRHAGTVGALSLGGEGGELLEEERVARGRRDDLFAACLTAGELRGEQHEQIAAVLSAQALDDDRLGRPVRMDLEELGPHEAQHEHRRLTASRDDVLESGRRSRLGPLSILDYHQKRPLPRQPRKQSVGRPADLFDRVGTLGVTEHARDPIGDHLRCILIEQKREDCVATLPAGRRANDLP